MAITRAIIPAAGLGTRLRPLTLAIPKEMLPLGRKPVLEYIVEELAACEIRDVLMVISPDKELIERYFGEGDRFGIRIQYTLQREMRGLGDAILHGEDWADGHPYLTAFGDCIIHSAHHTATRRLLASHEATGSFATVLTEPVPAEAVNRYGILTPLNPVVDSAGAFEFSRIVEKPNVESAPSRFAVAARWVLDSEIFAYLHRTSPDSKGELGLSQAVDLALQDGRRAWAAPLAPEESRVDIGSWPGYLKAAGHAIVNDEEAGDVIRRKICGQ